MNILIISRCPPHPIYLGDRHMLHHVSRQLAIRGHQCDLLAYYGDTSDPKQVAKYAHWFRRVDLIREPYRSPFSYVWRAVMPGAMFPRFAASAWSPLMWHSIRTALERQAYDLVLIFGGVQVYEFATLLRGLPTLIVPYESYTLYLERKLAQQTTARKKLSVAMQHHLAARFEQRMFTGYQRVVTISEVDAAMFRRLNPAYPVVVVEQGIDADYFKPSRPADDTPQVVFFGNFEYEPNLDAAHFLIDSIYPRLRKQLPTAKLLLVGNAAPIHLSKPGVEIIGRVPDLRPHIERSHVFLCPLRLGAGIKNKVLEAMALGKPIVATPISVDGLALTPDEHVVLGTTAQELSSAAVRLLQDAAARARMGAANRAMIEARYSWQHTADQYERLFEEITHPA
jgi:polysaccharide biosynthesis protein PslH